MSANKPTSSTLRTRFSVQPLDPYPERSTRLGGVRQHTEPKPSPARVLSTESQPAHHSAFAASLRASSSRSWFGWFPLASTILSVAGQAAIIAAIVTGATLPVMAWIVSLTWLLCSLCLITAQCVTIAGADR